MRIVLDTGVLFRPEALRAARSDGRRVVLPAIAYAERHRQLARDGMDTARFEAALAHAGIHVEPFAAPQARALPRAARDDAVWRRHARDALVAAHLEPRDELWTTNRRDFEALGVPRARLREW